MDVLRPGSKGSLVKVLQDLLNAHGFGPLELDGDFGPRTLDAVVTFQTSESLTPDGLVGPMTWARLMGEEPHEVEPDLRLHSIINALPQGIQRSVLETAFLDLGAKERPDGSNDGPEIAHLVRGYRQFHRIPFETMPKEAAWCAIAVSSWIGIALGLGSAGTEIDWKAHPFGTWQGSVRELERWASQNDAFVDPQPGAVFTQSRDGSGSDLSTLPTSGHCGLIVGTDPEGFSYTLEGNVSNRVVTRIRHHKTLRRFIKWW